MKRIEAGGTRHKKTHVLGKRAGAGSNDILPISFHVRQLGQQLGRAIRVREVARVDRRRLSPVVGGGEGIVQMAHQGGQYAWEYVQWVMTQGSIMMPTQECGRKEMWIVRYARREGWEGLVPSLQMEDSDRGLGNHRAGAGGASRLGGKVCRDARRVCRTSHFDLVCRA